MRTMIAGLQRALLLLTVFVLAACSGGGGGGGGGDERHGFFYGVATSLDFLSAEEVALFPRRDGAGYG